jgi:hypothetical protein
MPLTALAVRQAKPRNKPYKLFDERGLFLLEYVPFGHEDPGVIRL